jgi:hypothetical protein
LEKSDLSSNAINAKTCSVFSLTLAPKRKGIWGEGSGKVKFLKIYRLGEEFKLWFELRLD